ncbi:MAG: NIPSNAP family protein [Gemmatimonadota bacterium]
MLVELRLYRIKPGKRAQWLAFFEQRFLPYHRSVGVGTVLGYFLSYRDDEGFAWLHAFASDSDRDEARTLLWEGERWREDLAPVAKDLLRESCVHLLAPLPASRILKIDDIPLPSLHAQTNRVLEIRIYRIRPGRRDDFAEFFNTRTVAPQEANGMQILGQFKDLEDDNCFVWLRGFPDLETRDVQKAAFYDGDLWLKELEGEAFAMIEDYSNVWLVTPARHSLFQ